MLKIDYIYTFNCQEKASGTGLNEFCRRHGFDIEHQCPMDDFRITKKLGKALIYLEYLIEGSEK